MLVCCESCDIVFYGYCVRLCFQVKWNKKKAQMRSNQMIYKLKGKVFTLAIQSLLVGLSLFFSFPICLFISFSHFEFILKTIRKRPNLFPYHPSIQHP